MRENTRLRYTSYMLDLPLLAYILLALLLMIIVAIVWGAIAQVRLRRELPQRLDEQVETHQRAKIGRAHV